MDTQKKKLNTKIDDLSVMVGLSKTEAQTLIAILRKVEEGLKTNDTLNKDVILFVSTIVSKFFDVPRSALYEQNKTKRKTYCLSMICYILNTQYKFHPAYIGAHFGLHRTSIIHLTKKFLRILNSGDDQREVYNTVWEIIQKG